MTYEGFFIDGEIEGVGKSHFNSGDNYAGHYSKSKFNGYGFYKHSDGLEVSLLLDLKLHY